ncbi:MAG: methylated-DNA-protein-cysteine methyltransferase, methylated-DNA-[protein]-cysteine S-methyltransferase [Candidatus Peregrinibacteria bacterium GW2011_GWF2_33_10]|nr:MAG: methylated-DNA-protein-cysteine methyltransferase, methylated-DNA-[protein]-cysteine S-methyltransferase [Candidatus Peregrinibacteria bacterium GW2011_GWF2_33_10]OGJ45993.1 MAG: hypothetical protein A2263_02755 [Candidatus Peregrinibacteria bacterium RIFOXYA2_FULL_33_21]OGJ46320.1 MAG: hypothetical protein A2272_03505 [Candidatus Peregrinibacteria bacterium RIFOXYA12_FULL_33_12]OGJ51673.1 MAG: hypothetical protein A2307_04600 [Candidatus Peregrinibacteria bacterium RIFOXYB2_FULL_33_20]
MATFTQKVLEVVKNIPKGQVLTYKEVARLAGNEKACRAAGNILNKNRNLKVPCHRVIRSDGKAGGYFWGKDLKKQILREEGVNEKKGSTNETN